jgi:hypothetical protein
MPSFLESMPLCNGETEASCGLAGASCVLIGASCALPGLTDKLPTKATGHPAWLALDLRLDKLFWLALKVGDSWFETESFLHLRNAPWEGCPPYLGDITETHSWGSRAELLLSRAWIPEHGFPWCYIASWLKVWKFDWETQTWWFSATQLSPTDILEALQHMPHSWWDRRE